MNKSPSNSAVPELGGSQSRIPRSFCIRGEISGHEPTAIAGHVEGVLRFEQAPVTIDSEGEVSANIDAGELVVMGKVCGNTRGTHLDVRSGGSLVGDIVANSITVDTRGLIRGRVDFQNKVKPKVAIRAATVVVVEDERRTLFSMLSGLELNELSILTASNPNTAWRLFESAWVALVLMDGAYAAEGRLGPTMKHAKPAVPIVVLSDNWTGLEALGFADLLLSKNIGAERLQVHLRALLNANRRQAA